jgi:hypothetical protein
MVKMSSALNSEMHRDRWASAHLSLDVGQAARLERIDNLLQRCALHGIVVAVPETVVEPALGDAVVARVGVKAKDAADNRVDQPVGETAVRRRDRGPSARPRSVGMVPGSSFSKRTS